MRSLKPRLRRGYNHFAMTKKKKLALPFLISLYLVVILFFSFYLLLHQTIFQNKAIGEDYPPEEVKISNVSSRSFTVSWLTEGITNGMVIFGESRDFVENFKDNLKTGFDDRGPATFSKTHYVTLHNLSPERQYFFLIQSGPSYYFRNLAGSWEKTGLAVEQKTGSEINFNPGKPISSTNTEGSYSLEPGSWDSCSDGTKNGLINPCFRPNLIYGQVFDENNQNVPEAIVYLEIPGKSSLLSGLANSKGKWSVNLANLRETNLAGYLAYDPTKDLIRLSFQEEEKGFSSVYKLIPNVVSTNCLGLSPKNCSTAPVDETNPVIAQLLPQSTTSPISSLSPTSSQTQTLPSATPTPFALLELKIKLQAVGQKAPDINISLIFKKEGQDLPYLSKNLTIMTDDLGNYRGIFTPAPIGTFDISVKEPFHLSRKITSFKVLPGKNSLDLSLTPLTAGDLNNDNRVNAEDLGIFVAEYRSSKPQLNLADLNFDGQVNSEDLGILLSNYRGEGQQP